MKVVGVLNNKGGVGKTFFAVHIAWKLAEFGYRVLLIDADINQRDAVKWISRGKVREPEGNRKYEIETNLDVFAVPVDFYFDFKNLTRGYNFVIIDGRPQAEVIVSFAEAIDVLVVPIAGELARVNAIDMLGEMAEFLKGKVILGVVNMLPRGQKVSMELVKRMRESGIFLFGEPVWEYSYVRIAEKDYIPVWEVKGVFRTSIPYFFTNLCYVLVKV